MTLSVVANDDRGLWEIHDEIGHVCDLESESTANELVRAFNHIPKVHEVLKLCEQALKDHVQYEGDDGSLEGDAWRAVTALLKDLEEDEDSP